MLLYGGGTQSFLAYILCDTICIFCSVFYPRIRTLEQRVRELSAERQSEKAEETQGVAVAETSRSNADLEKENAKLSERCQNPVLLVYVRVC